MKFPTNRFSYCVSLDVIRNAFPIMKLKIDTDFMSEALIRSEMLCEHIEILAQVSGEEFTFSRGSHHRVDSVIEFITGNHREQTFCTY